MNADTVVVKIAQLLYSDDLFIYFILLIIFILFLFIYLFFFFLFIYFFFFFCGAK